MHRLVPSKLFRNVCNSSWCFPGWTAETPGSFHIACWRVSRCSTLASGAEAVPCFVPVRGARKVLRGFPAGTCSAPLQPSDPRLELTHRGSSDKTVIWVRFVRALPTSETSLRCFDACKAATQSSALKTSSQSTLPENWVRLRCLVLPLLLACVLPAALGVSQSPFQSKACVKRATVVCCFERWAKHRTKNWVILFEVTQRIYRKGKDRNRISQVLGLSYDHKPVLLSFTCIVIRSWFIKISKGHSAPYSKNQTMQQTIVFCICHNLI